MINTNAVSAPEFEKIIRKYGNSIYRIALIKTNNEADAQDIVQEAFLKYVKNVNSFESEEHEKAWLIRVTINLCKNLLKSAWKNKIDELNEINSPFADFKEKTSFVYDAVLRLPDKYRDIIHLYYYEGYNIKEISELLEQKESTTKSQMSRARKLLKKLLKNEHE